MIDNMDILYMDGWTVCPKGWKDLDNCSLKKSTTINYYKISEQCAEMDIANSNGNTATATATTTDYNTNNADCLICQHCSDEKNNHNLSLSDLNQEHVFVLAGGLDPNGDNHSWVKNRLDLFLQLYALKKRYVYILGGGTYHKPPHLNKQGFVMHECNMGAKYLIENGVEPSYIRKEWASYDTIANTYFSYALFASPLNMKKALIITSDFQMERAEMLFKWIYSMGKNEEIELKFIATISSNMNIDIFKARVKKEKESIESLKKIISRVETMEKFVDWFYSEHKAYNCDFIQNINGLINTVDSITSSSY